MTAIGTYRDWSALRYEPRVEAFHPEALVNLVPSGGSVLEIGCHGGIVSTQLASRRPDITVVGVDINPTAIDAARKLAAARGLSNVSFEEADATHVRSQFDAVVAIRVLTCFPMRSEWDALVTAIAAALRPKAICWITDFVLDDGNSAYAPRYAEGAARGWRAGNFAVRTESGEFLFIAHHHTQEEIECLTQMLSDVHLRPFRSLSMHGNPVSMFELVGRRSEAAA